MAIYNVAQIFKPQYVAAGAAALVYAPAGWSATIPAGYNLQIQVARVANNSAAPVSLEVWRVPSGSSVDAQHIVCPPINVPVASNTQPQFDLTALWGVVLYPGDTIVAIAGSGTALVIQADGLLIQV